MAEISSVKLCVKVETAMIGRLMKAGGDLSSTWLASYANRVLRYQTSGTTWFTPAVRELTPSSGGARDNSEAPRRDEAHKRAHVRLHLLFFHHSFHPPAAKPTPTAVQALFTTCYPRASPSSALSSLSFLHSFCLPHMFFRPPPIAPPTL